jgi:AhpD family alkylhydroperoxidase
VTKRISLGGPASEPGRQLRQLHALVEKTAADAGLDQRLIELVKIRSSMLNGCAFCLDMHTRGARKLKSHSVTQFSVPARAQVSRLQYHLRIRKM